MYFDWDRHWWLIIILAIFAVPIVQALFEPWRRYLRYRQQKDAIDALKVYAAQNREPPPEVLDALGGRQARWRAAGAAIGEAAARATDDRWARRQDRWDRRWERRIAGEPLRRWNGAIFAGAVAGGFGLAWYYGHDHNDTFLIVAIIAGALTLAAVISATIASLWRFD